MRRGFNDICLLESKTLIVMIAHHASACAVQADLQAVVEGATIKLRHPRRSPRHVVDVELAISLACGVVEHVENLGGPS